MHAGRLILAIASSVLAAGCSSPAARPSARVEAPPPIPAIPAAPMIGPATAAGWSTIGRSVEGRPIEAATLGGGPLRVLLIGGIHGDEPEGGATIRAVTAYLGALQPEATVRIVRDMNPDGTAARTRENARGVDLNRNWPAKNFQPGADRGGEPASEPETRAVLREIEAFSPELVLVLHASHRGPFVNFDGDSGALAAAFASAAAATDPRWRVVPNMGYPTPGSLGSFLGVDRGVPILTVEFARGHPPEAAWMAMRDGLPAVFGRVLLAR